MENDWIPWDGGDCPVDPETLVAVKFRNERECVTGNADVWQWDHVDDPYDIIAYKVLP